jgi:hypothetical protein
MRRLIFLAQAIAVVAFTTALAISGPASGKACEQLGGGACKGHWACNTDDGSTGFCNDDGTKDCYCKKGPRSRHHARASHGAASESEEQQEMQMPPKEAMPPPPEDQGPPQH